MSGNRVDARTPLLRDASGLPMAFGSLMVQDHPIFLRVCHSPWSWLNQSKLTYIRGGIVAYLTAVGIMILDYKIEKREDEHNAWRILFQFSSLAFALLWIYHVIAFCWTFTHLYYPDNDVNDPCWERKIVAVLSPPVQKPHHHNRFYFSVFYSAVHVFTLMNTLIYLTVLVPHGHGHESGIPHVPDMPPTPGLDDPINWPIEWFAEGWFRPFVLFNQWFVTSFLVFVEIFQLNSVNRQVPVPSHVFSLVFLLSSWLVWAAFGFWATGHAPYFWMDRTKVGSKELVAAYASSFLGMGPVVFSFMYGLIGMRENLTKRERGSEGGQARAGNLTVTGPQNGPDRVLRQDGREEQRQDGRWGGNQRS